MAAVTRKRSAFSVFKVSHQPDREKKTLAVESTPNLEKIGLSEFEENKLNIKAKGRTRRGSLPDLNPTKQVFRQISVLFWCYSRVNKDHADLELRGRG